MDAYQICFKLGFSAPESLTFEDLIPVFHQWIQRDALGDDVMIDVADYGHVPDGPGVVLVCHEGHYVIDRRNGAWGLSYNRKRGGEQASLQERLGVPFKRLMTAATLLAGEQGIGPVSFDTGELRLQVQDRLRASNDDATFDAFAPALREFIASRYGAAPTALERKGQARELFTVQIRNAERPTVDMLASR